MSTFDLTPEAKAAKVKQLQEENQELIERAEELKSQIGEITEEITSLGQHHRVNDECISFLQGQ